MLSGRMRKHLRALAHSLRPAVQIGKEGLSEAVVAAIETGLEAHELIKVQIRAERDSRRELVGAIERATGSECVGEVGHMAILFRRHPDPERQTITLPGE